MTYSSIQQKQKHNDLRVLYISRVLGCRLPGIPFMYKVGVNWAGRLGWDISQQGYILTIRAHQAQLHAKHTWQISADQAAAAVS